MLCEFNRAFIEPPHGILNVITIIGATRPSQTGAAETSGRPTGQHTFLAGTLQGTCPQAPGPGTPSCPGCPGLPYASCSSSLYADSSPGTSGRVILDPAAGPGVKCCALCRWQALHSVTLHQLRDSTTASSHLQSTSPRQAWCIQVPAAVP